MSSSSVLSPSISSVSIEMPSLKGERKQASSKQTLLNDIGSVASVVKQVEPPETNGESLQAKVTAPAVIHIVKKQKGLPSAQDVSRMKPQEKIDFLMRQNGLYAQKNEELRGQKRALESKIKDIRDTSLALISESEFLALSPQQQKEYADKMYSDYQSQHNAYVIDINSKANDAFKENNTLRERVNGLDRRSSCRNGLILCLAIIMLANTVTTLMWRTR